MNRTQITNDLAEVSGNKYFCKKKDICDYLGVSLNTAKKYINGLDAVNGRLYHIEEVATRILSEVNQLEDNNELKENDEHGCDDI